MEVLAAYERKLLQAGSTRTCPLNQQEAAAVNLYTQSEESFWGKGVVPFYERLNTTLREKANDRDALEPYFPYLHFFLTALYKLRGGKLPRSIQLFRGMRRQLDKTQMKKGSRIFWWQVSSCSYEFENFNNPLGSWSLA